MALIPLYRVWETTTTTGVGTYDLSGAVADDPDWGKFIAFVDLMATADTCYYTVIGLSGGSQAFEVGIGTFTDAAPDTLGRSTILQSYTSGGGAGTSAVSWDSGAKQIYGSLDPGGFLVASNNLSDITSVATALSNIGAFPSAGGTISGGTTIQAMLQFTTATAFMRAAAGPNDVRFTRTDGGSAYAILVNLDENDEYTKASAKACRIEIDKSQVRNLKVFYADGQTLGRSVGDDATLDWFVVFNTNSTNGEGAIQINAQGSVYSGTGVPSDSTGATGDFYLRNSSGTNTTDRIYIKKSSGSPLWAALST